MKKAIFFISFLFFNPIIAQEFSPEIFTLSESTKIEDFDFLKKELQGIQVVMLGENFTTFVDSYWSDFNILNPQKIRNKDEEHLFKKISN